MPQRVWVLIGCFVLAAWMVALPVRGGQPLRAAPLADQPTNTGTPLPPTPTTTQPPGTPTPTGQLPPNTPTPTGQLPPDTPTATPKERTPQRGDDPTKTPTPTETPVGDPRVSKSADPSSGFPGDKITFTITVRNDGVVPATDVEVEDSVPGVFEISGASTSQGSVDVSGQRIHAVIGTIPPGESVTIRISTTIRADAQPGQVDNVAIMSNTTPGDIPGNNTSTTTVTIEGGGPPPSATPAPPARLPPTGDDAPWLALPILLATAVLLGGLALRARRRAG